ncbi:sulfatase-like hydrolase/transferase [Candidatus Omnitrophota bacterium]
MYRKHDYLGPSIDKLSRFIIIAVICTFLLSKIVLSLITINNTSGSTPQSSLIKRGVIVIVVDQLGAKYLKIFNKEAETSTPYLDNLSRESVVFRNFHTNAVHTLNSFGCLYSGTYDYEQSDPKVNLISVLQKNGINTKIISGYRTSMPDLTNQIYRGLRGYFLTEHFTFLPRLLGLDYQITRKPRKTVFKMINSVFPYKHPFGILKEEVEYLVSNKRNFFILLHVNVGDRKYSSADTTPLWEDLDTDKVDTHKTEKRIRKNSYRYTEKDEWWVNEKKSLYLDNIGHIDKSIESFIDFLKQNNIYKDVSIIITADHGSSYEDGKIWYGYHINEAVTWVPLIIKNGKTRGADERMCETVDIPSTILDIFDIKEKLSGRGIPLTTKQRHKKYTVSISSGKIKNRPGSKFYSYLAVYDKNKKHVFTVDANNNEIKYLKSYMVDARGNSDEMQFQDLTIIESLSGESIDNLSEILSRLENAD